MTATRGLFMAMLAVALLIGAYPIEGDAQFPRGLMMSTEPRGGGQGGHCLIETRPLSFGNYDPLAGTDVDAIGQIIYFCQGSGDGGGGDGRGGGPPDGRGGGPGTRAQNKGIRIELDWGSSNSNDWRQMVGGPRLDSLAYNIYLDSTHRTVWGTGTNGTEVYIDLNPPLDTPVTVPLYGRIFGRQTQDMEAGSYVDQVGVRIQF